ncbi:proto-oncogene DBL-like [Diorhabda carinulata]|uniref:proto-oncogene DBL-like n=1 Tax=Diorhabda carinulata TaxID=1163345 RepID=UPI0025A1B12B|nr:proto-oncogene DBL-like [Diorhabda carinulata]
MFYANAEAASETASSRDLNFQRLLKGSNHSMKMVRSRSTFWVNLEDNGEKVKFENNDKHAIAGSSLSHSSPIALDEAFNKVKTESVLNNLLESEKMYVRDLLAVLKGYKDASEYEHMQVFLPPDAGEKLTIIFGNLEDICKFHTQQFILGLSSHSTTSGKIAKCFMESKNMMYLLYSNYCINLPNSEKVRENSPELKSFFQLCQEISDHDMPLAAYLLKPVQRITEYQVFLNDLLKYCQDANAYAKLRKAVDCFGKVLKSVNDRLYQRCITDLYLNLSQQGELLLKGRFTVWYDHKLLSLAKQRFVLLYQRALLFCKPISKATEDQASYQFKNYLPMSQIGLTEYIKDDNLKFEIWSKGRQEVYVIKAPNLEMKETWVNQIKKLLLKQMKRIERKQLRENEGRTPKFILQNREQETSSFAVEKVSSQAAATNSNDTGYCCQTQIYVAFKDYYANTYNEVNIEEGDIVELLKVKEGGWWYVRIIVSDRKGWASGAIFRKMFE